MVITQSLTQTFKRNSYFMYIFLLAVALYLPVTMIWTGIISFKHRFALMFGMLGVMIFYVFLRGHSLSDLGFRRDTLKQSLKWNLLISLFFVSFLVLLYRMNVIAGKSAAPLGPLFFIFYILILSPVQEFFFRSILFAEMRNIRHRYHWAIIVLSTFSFCFLHVIYHYPTIVLVTLCMGLVWSIIYYKYPNIWGVSLSHAMLGVTAFLIGLI